MLFEKEVDEFKQKFCTGSIMKILPIIHTQTDESERPCRVTAWPLDRRRWGSNHWTCNQWQWNHSTSWTTAASAPSWVFLFFCSPINAVIRADVHLDKQPVQYLACIGMFRKPWHIHGLMETPLPGGTTGLPPDLPGSLSAVRPTPADGSLLAFRPTPAPASPLVARLTPTLGSAPNSCTVMVQNSSIAQYSSASKSMDSAPNRADACRCDGRSCCLSHCIKKQ